MNAQQLIAASKQFHEQYVERFGLSDIALDTLEIVIMPPLGSIAAGPVGGGPGWENGSAIIVHFREWEIDEW